MIKRHICDGDAGIGRVGEVGQRLLAGRVVLAEDHLLLGTLPTLPSSSRLMR